MIHYFERLYFDFFCEIQSFCRTSKLMLPIFLEALQYHILLQKYLKSTVLLIIPQKYSLYSAQK